MKLHDKEEFKFDQGANLKRGLESVGGKLKVTNERMIFKAHGLNVQKETLEIFNQDIAKVRETKTLGIIPNGLEIELNNGEIFKFVVGKRKEIKAFLDKF